MKIYNENIDIFDGDGFGYFKDGICAYYEDINNYEPWSGAVCRYEEIVEAGKLEQLAFILEDIYHNGMSETELNDFIWFEEDTWREWLDMSENEEEEEEYVYAIEDTRGLPQCGCETIKFEDWGEVEEYLEENPDVNKRIEEGYARIIEL